MRISLSTVLLNFVFNMILIPNYGYLGAGVAFLLSQFVSSVISLLLSMKLVPYLRYYWEKMYLFCFIFFLLCISIFLLQLIDDLWYRLILKVFFMLCVFGCVSYIYRHSLRLFKNQILNKNKYI